MAETKRRKDPEEYDTWKYAIDEKGTLKAYEDRDTKTGKFNYAEPDWWLSEMTINEVPSIVKAIDGVKYKLPDSAAISIPSSVEKCYLNAFGAYKHIFMTLDVFKKLHTEMTYSFERYALIELVTGGIDDYTSTGYFMTNAYHSDCEILSKDELIQMASDDYDEKQNFKEVVRTLASVNGKYHIIHLDKFDETEVDAINDVASKEKYSSTGETSLFS